MTDHSESTELEGGSLGKIFGKVAKKGLSKVKKVGTKSLRKTTRRSLKKIGRKVTKNKNLGKKN